MRELQHYADWDETVAMIRDVALAHQLTLIPDEPRLVEPRLTAYPTFVPEVAEKLARHRVLHLEGPFTRHPLQFERRDSGPAAGTYFVDFMIGPRLRWILPAMAAGPRPVLTSGTISYLKAYRDPVSRAWEDPTDELVDAFAAVVATMKERLIAIKHGPDRRRIWVGRETHRQLEAGTLFIDL
jgi:hypothetical protein